jgi:hypothetical protein
MTVFRFLSSFLASGLQRVCLGMEDALLLKSITESGGRTMMEVNSIPCTEYGLVDFPTAVVVLHFLKETLVR